VAEPAHRRGQAVADTVLDTTLALITEQGAAFSIDEVAAAAGVHKTTVYRRWPTKPALIGAAAERLATAAVPPVTTGDPIADLRTLAVSVAKVLRTPSGGALLRAVVAAGAEDPDTLPVARGFLTGRYRLATALIADAQRSGTIRADVDAILLWEAMVNPLHVRALLGSPASDATARKLVDLVLRGSTAPADQVKRGAVI
jgi:AcrR family transcriptional regulator